jgi:thiol:disulfide interchange protein DsbD
MLALSMFKLVHLPLLSRLQNRLAQVVNRQRAGKLAGVFVMGAVSALIMSPCVAAPLASALIFISQTRDVWIGGVALFSMAVGMSLPLILIGASAGVLLPKTGRWMESVKQCFGVMVLATALWLIAPVAPTWLPPLGWSGLLLGYGLFLLRHAGMLPKLIAVILCAIGAIGLAGLASGRQEILTLVTFMAPSENHALEFVRVKSNQELDQALAQAKTRGQPVMLDFYADWCVACKEMEKLTFSDERIRARLATTLLLQVDVTANTNEDKKLLKRFNLFGPPGIIFFDAHATESSRVIGFENAEQFEKSIPL